MVLKFVINGYYRTGTTIIARILKLSNPELLYFHEPTSSIIINDIQRFRDQPHGLHGFPIYEDYLKLGEDFLRFFSYIHRPYDFVLQPSECVRILSFFHSLPHNCFVKCNQLHLVLDVVAEAFKVPVIHIIRDPVEVLFDHVYPEYQNDQEILKKIFIERDRNYFKYLGFWLFDIYRSIKQRYGIRAENENDPIEVFAINYITLNTIAKYLCDRAHGECYITKFEEFLEDPYLIYEILCLRGIDLNEKYLELLDKNKAFKAPEWLRKEATPIINEVRRRVQSILQL